MPKHPRVSRPVAHHWAFTFPIRRARCANRTRSCRLVMPVTSQLAPLAPCIAKESSLVARPYQSRLHTHAAMRTEPGDRTLQTWLVRPRTSPAVLARRSSGPWTRTTISSVKGSRPTIRRSQNAGAPARSRTATRDVRSIAAKSLGEGVGVPGWSRTTSASFVASLSDPPARTWHRVRVSSPSN